MSSRLPVKCSVEKNESHDSSVRRSASILPGEVPKTVDVFWIIFPLLELPVTLMTLY